MLCGVVSIGGCCTGIATLNCCASDSAAVGLAGVPIGVCILEEERPVKHQANTQLMLFSHVDDHHSANLAASCAPGLGAEQVLFPGAVAASILHSRAAGML
jgi:hypothetical protein